MQRAKQISDSIELGIILALAGGFMDAYSYMARGQVFRELLALGARQAEPVTAEEGREALRRFRPPEVWSEETLKRRASTAVSWVNWLLRPQGEEERQLSFF